MFEKAYTIQHKTACFFFFFASFLMKTDPILDLSDICKRQSFVRIENVSRFKHLCRAECAINY